MFVGHRISQKKQEPYQKNIGKQTIVRNEPAVAHGDSCIFFPLLITWKITRGEKMFEVVAASPVHHVGCTPCGLTKIILKPKNKKKYK